MKKALALAMTLLLLFMLAACGEKEPEQDPFVGAFGGTASYNTEVELVIHQDNTISYKDGMQMRDGTWSKCEDGSIALDFGGELFGRGEPMIATLSDDGNTITVAMPELIYEPSVYQRQEP